MTIRPQMADDTPRITSTLERARLLMTSFIFFQALLIWQRNYWLGAAFFLVGVYATLNVVRVLSTRVSSAGISQISWRGRVQLPYVDVTSVSRTKRCIALKGAGGSIVVPIESFYDTKAAVQYFESHLPQHLRQY
jgi:hypothetical protein